MTATELQAGLIELGYPLPKYGADGDIGPETLAALAKFASDRGLSKSLAPMDYGAAISRELLRRDIGTAVSGASLIPIDLTESGPGLQWRSRATRPWSQITGITLHQTACLMGERPQGWYGLNAHLAVTRNGLSYLVCPLDRVVWHGNGFNGSDVGIEVDGYFEGIEGNRRTLWNPADQPNRAALIPTAGQLASTRSLVRWIMGEVAQRGGNVRHIHAHRQSSNMRQSDPGSRIWRDVGVWAQRELGLSDGGDKYVAGSGLPIPREWDEKRSGRY